MANKSNRVEEYKESIKNLLKITQYDRIEKLKEDIRNFIDINFKNNKITEEEYDELNEFYEELLQMEIENSILNEKSEKCIQEKSMSKEGREEFINRMKKELPIINPIIMYRGNIGKKAPGRNKYNQDNQKEGDER